MSDQTKTQTQPPATPGQAQAATPAPAPAAEKKARINLTQIGRAAEWLKGNAGKYIASGLSSGCVARVASKILGFDITKQQVEQIAAGAGVPFPEMKPTERLTVLEDKVVELSRQNAELRSQAGGNNQQAKAA